MSASVFFERIKRILGVVLGARASPCSSAVTERNRIDRFGAGESFVYARAISSRPALPEALSAAPLIDLVALQGSGLCRDDPSARCR